MACSGRYATADQFAAFWCLGTLTAAEQATIETFLDIAASDIHAALGAVGACDCTWATWADDYMVKLNVIEAMIIHNCPCANARITDDMKRAWLDWINNQFTAIAQGKLVFCQDETGADYPYLGWAQQGVDDFTKGKLIHQEDDY